MSDRNGHDPAAGARLEVALAEGMSFDGLLVLTRPARIDGHTRGSVCADGAVEVGANGWVEADLDACDVVIEGRVDGDVAARSAITLGRGAAVVGDLSAPNLRMAEGARIEGRVRCGEASAAPREAPAVPPSENPRESRDPGSSAP
jgi:cytoskeletal protein CcmA (bactofilin family)